MRVLGLIVEYNPFHNGHLYHLEQAKSLCNADYVLCVMSGNYIQRGEPAIVNKWARAKMALQCGVDLVIELPVPYAMSSAEFFAFGAVKILNDIGVVNYLCFGSETADINTFDIIADILVSEPESYKNVLKQELGKGKSFPSARETALKSFLSEKGTDISDFEAVIGSSNNILGIEYIKALKRLKSRITPVTIKRINNSYNSEEITGSISSATSIRKLIQTQKSQLDAVLPANCLNILEEEFDSGRGPIYPNNYELLILSNLRRMTKEEIRMLPYVSEGMENRIKVAAETSGTWDELIEKICTKRYTRTRVQRILTGIMTGLTSVDFDSFNKFGGPQYARVLGLNNKGRQLLSYMNKVSRIPIITKTADFTNSCNPLLRKMLKIEAFATDMYVLGYPNLLYRKAGQEFTQNVIVIK
ncbi:nucleotidyltransferase [Acetivibrio clariflavus]|uniref:tRNA(Met) cytidine acetate ligase n=1 Tax=Acetivibrio clariflavus (strain DSM 19732 / NBRC 101661 / EBR45) TaxID=720554 RepID=G8LYA4_ACECE|nr:nucleotidyltransferase [Acetivibrio clariflavus]AEV68873.1 putative nucleotidyltransferase [Acetivibrio clariflavus DSM 19732]